MATKTYTTSITVQFSTDDDSDKILAAEIDGREEKDGGLNKGDTSFVPGVDDPYILVFKSSDVTIDDTDSSAGSFSPSGSGNFVVEDYLTFANDKEATLSKPIGNTKSVAYKWMGDQHGTPTITENKVTVPNDIVGVLKIEYSSPYIAYRLTGIPAAIQGETEFPVVVFIAGSG